MVIFHANIGPHNPNHIITTTVLTKYFIRTYII